MRKTFTFTEMMTALAILAILGSLLLPAVNQARIKNKAVVCSSNLSSIGKGMYILINNGSPSGRDRAFPGYAGRDKNNQHYTWYGEIAWILNQAQFSYEPYFKDRQHVPEVFMCPDANAKSEFTNERLPYGYNYGNLGDYQTHDKINNQHARRAVRLIEIHQPAKMLMITDSNDDAIYDHLTGRWPNAHPGGRHSAKANTLFVDGHVKAYLVPQILNQEQQPYFENQN